jgi:hypothetical protein
MLQCTLVRKIDGAPGVSNPNISPGNAMIVPISLFRCGFAIEPIAQLDDAIAARARSAWVGNTLYFVDIPGIFNINSALIAFLSGRVKVSG